MKLKTLLQGLVVSASLFCAGPALSGQVIGAPADPGTGNCFPFGCSYGGQYQQVYNAGAFSGPVTITSLSFYNTAFNSGAFSMNAGNWAISLSTTTVDSNTISGSFASNIGGDNTLVFSGDLVQPWAFGSTLNISLSTAFTYDPGNGNLLMDVFVTGATEPGGSIYFDVKSNSGVLGRVYNGGTVEHGYGLVTGFNMAAAVPEPETYAMMLAGLGMLGFAARRRKLRGVASA